jgi:hypothetical protein
VSKRCALRVVGQFGKRRMHVCHGRWRQGTKNEGQGPGARRPPRMRIGDAIWTARHSTQWQRASATASAVAAPYKACSVGLSWPPCRHRWCHGKLTPAARPRNGAGARVASTCRRVRVIVLTAAVSFRATTTRTVTAIKRRRVAASAPASDTPPNARVQRSAKEKKPASRPALGWSAFLPVRASRR